MRPADRTNIWVLTALSLAVGIVSILALVPGQIRPRPVDVLVGVCAYFASVALLAVLYTRLHATSTLARTLPTFLGAAAVSLAIAALGLQVSFAYVRELDPLWAAALAFVWIVGSLAIAIGAAARTMLNGSFARGFALTALALSAVALALFSLPWLGVGR